MKCAQCGEMISAEYRMILLNADGDFACSPECKEKYEAEKKRFLEKIVDSPEKTQNYLMGAN